MQQYVRGGTVPVEFICSNAPSINSIHAALISASATVVSSGAMTNSGDGGYGAYLPASYTGFYSVRVDAYLGTYAGTATPARMRYQTVVEIIMEGV